MHCHDRQRNACVHFIDVRPHAVICSMTHQLSQAHFLPCSSQATCTLAWGESAVLHACRQPLLLLPPPSRARGRTGATLLQPRSPSGSSWASLMRMSPVWLPLLRCPLLGRVYCGQAPCTAGACCRCLKRLTRPATAALLPVCVPHELQREPHTGHAVLAAVYAEQASGKCGFAVSSCRGKKARQFQKGLPSLLHATGGR